MNITKISPKKQITIPRELFDRLDLGVGDYLEANIKAGKIVLTPKKLVPKNQAWFWSKEWQEREKEADDDIKASRITGPFNDVDGLIKSLRSE